MSLPLTAAAQQKSSCPPGAWFCADADVQVPGLPAAKPKAAIAPPPAAEEDEPPADPAPARRRPRKQRPVVEEPGAPPPPPVVVYQPVPSAPPPDVVVISPGYHHRRSRAVPPPPDAPKDRWRPEFGFNLRVEGLAMGHMRGSAGSAGMGGVGMSLRYRPVPHFAFDLGVDFLAGNDYNGFQRTELPVSLNGIFYVNPRSRVQFYFVGGAHFSHAEVRSDVASPLLTWNDGSQYGTSYTYFGGQGGGGFEFRVSRRVALNLDAIGFFRERIDDGKTPEFVDLRSGATTNSSAGALIRGGLTFWW